MKLFEIFNENVDQKPFTIKIRTPNEQDTFDNFISKVLPVNAEFAEEDIQRELVTVDDDVDLTSIVLLSDGRIGYTDTLGESHISDKPIPVQEFISKIHQLASKF